MDEFRHVNAARLRFKENWLIIWGWCSFLVENFVERPVYFLDGDSFHDATQINITKLLWLLTMPTSRVAAVVVGTPGCVAMIARLYLQGAVQTRKSPTNDEELLYASRAMQNFTMEDPSGSTWNDEYISTMNKASPAMANVIIHRVILGTERRPFNCKSLADGLTILSNVAQAPGFHKRFLSKGSVEWVCHIMRKIVSRKIMLTPQNSFFTTKVLKMSAIYLNTAIDHGRHPCVSQVLDHNILPSVLKSAPFLKGDSALLAAYDQLLEMIASYSMYRSALRTFDKARNFVKHRDLERYLVVSPLKSSWTRAMKFIEPCMHIRKY
ncbi:hypothetical protein GYMLUDRAFT_400976 [Collybiopsis luxurians FD-317 M1]|nr:hypothetical protein GYMLUDRAFT_400976 [Collybiopsis luxurians FD-317 M1]